MPFKILHNCSRFGMKFFSYFLVITMLFSFFIQPVFGQCTGCTVSITSSNQVIPSNQNVAAVICFQGNFTYSANFNVNGSQICIGQGVTLERSGGNWDGAWTVNNHGTLKINSLNLNSDNTINNYGELIIPGSLNLNGRINLAGTLSVGGDLHLNGTGRISALNTNQCNAITVNGAFTSDGLITGSDLDYAGTGSGLLVNKMPGGNAVTKLSGGARVGNCTMVNCVETVSTKGGGRTDMVYIYRCSGTFSPPAMVDDLELSGVMLFLVAGGGGGGMGESAGGGGAGSMFESNNIELEVGTTYQVIVGQGGIGANNINSQGGNGSPSSFIGFTTIGGGGGGSSSVTESIRIGRDGGSGGGGAANADHIGGGGAGIGLFVTRGGNALRNNSNVRAGGGGGGASSVGINGNPPDPGHGGNGRLSSVLADLNIPSLPNRFSAGGGGTGRNSSNNPVALGRGGTVNEIIIGGDGNNLLTGRGRVGKSNTGSGGGAGGGGGGAGAPGIVVLRLSFGILPVTYSYLDAVYHSGDRKAEIRWATSKEWENSHFEIERSINNINNWAKVGEVKGMGWSDENTAYEFKDSLLLARGRNYYYRLKQVDFNLEYEYSKTVMVNVSQINQSSMWAAYPNPIYNGDLLSIASKVQFTSERDICIKVISSQTTIYSFQAATESDIHDNLRAILPELPKGLFVLEFSWEDKQEYIKLIKR